MERIATSVILSSFSPWLIRALLAPLAVVAPSFAQGRASEFLYIPAYRGTVTATGSGSGTSQVGPISIQWSYTINASITASRMPSMITGTWEQNVTGTGTISYDESFVDHGCSIKASYRSGPLDYFESLSLGVAPPNGYYFQGAASWTHGTVHLTAPGDGCGGSADLPWLPSLGFRPADILTLPAAGFSLTGSQSLQVRPYSIIAQPQPLNVTYQWDFEPDCSSSVTAKNTAAAAAPGCGVEVVVPMDFADWRPQAGNNATRGNAVTLTAKLQARGGGLTTIKATEFKWEFVDVSSVEGYAMNAPLINASKDPDLKFENGSDVVAALDGKSATTPPGNYSQSRATIGSYDWGGYAKVRVTATVPNQGPIVGYLEGDPAQTEIRVPKRAATSQIADVWKKDHSVAGLADSDDNETNPPGDGHPGDGLTLYEEYRGFIIDGDHKDSDQADPTTKDLFVVNKVASSLPGIKLFENLSKLRVHYNLKQFELDTFRVINFNHDSTPNIHKVDQHGLIIEPWNNAGSARAEPEPAIGRLGTPGMIQAVYVPRGMPTIVKPGQDPSGLGSPRYLFWLQTAVAHELLHACGVYHHGDKPRTVTWVRLSPTTVIENTIQSVSLLTESGVPDALWLPLGQPWDQELGQWGDWHSGNDNCVMRYENASWYESRAKPATDRYKVYPPEMPGLGLCDSKKGTGVNDSTRSSPQPRYGDATRGECQYQIRVDDAPPLPPVR